ncbi:MAG TPA: endonuclease domain-containing protein [Dehalococcoidia bacterium]|nr:endonuclease domain-containing protein [Dehalococcoidia bacterium]
MVEPTRDDQGKALMAFGRDMRRSSTEAERVLWSRLRNRQVVRAKFRRQHAFGTTILDPYCDDNWLAIEVDGGQHYNEMNHVRDEERTAFLYSKGVRVLRFSNHEVLTEIDAVFDVIHQALATPHSLLRQR